MNQRIGNSLKKNAFFCMVWVGFHVHENGVWGSEREKKGGFP